LSGRTLIETVDGERREQTLTGDSDVLDAYRAHFDVVIDCVPEAKVTSVARASSEGPAR
jgi:hypothetical protein